MGTYIKGETKHAAKLEEENVKDLRFPTQAKMAESNKNAVTWVCYMRAHGRLTILPDHLK